MIFDSLASSVLRNHSFQMDSSRFQAFMILISTHILVETFKRNFPISPRFLHNSDCKQGECKYHKYFYPCLLGSKLLWSTMSSNYVFEDIDTLNFWLFFHLLFLSVFTEYFETKVVDKEVL